MNYEEMMEHMTKFPRWLYTDARATLDPEVRVVVLETVVERMLEWYDNLLTLVTKPRGGE